MKFKLIFICVCISIFVNAAFSKYVIKTGQDMPTLDYVIENINEMTKEPFDGFVMLLQNQQGYSHHVFTDKRIQRETFKESISKLKQLDFKKLNNNFILTWATVPNKKARWFDDEYWDAICHNIRVNAWAAKEIGFKGLLFDAEYYFGYSPWFYNHLEEKDKYSFAEYEKQVRLRGRQFMQAIQSEYPDVTILMYFGPHCLWPATETNQPEIFLENYMFGLLRAFYQGWFDVLDKQATLIEGNELAYYYHTQQDFDLAARQLYSNIPKLFDEESRGTFLRQVKSGFGIMIDLPPFGEDINKNLFTPEEIEEKILWAMSAGEYVWIYNENPRHWWKHENIPEEYYKALENALSRFRQNRDNIRPWTDLVINLIPSDKKSPVIDGDLSDLAWQRAAFLDKLKPVGDSNVSQTQVWITADKEAVYFAFNCKSNSLDENIVINNDDLSRRDRVVFCLSEGRQSWPYYEISVDSSNNRSDSYKNYKNIDLELESSVKRSDDGWVGEIKISWNEMRKIMPDYKEPVFAQIFRYENNDSIVGAWATTNSKKIEYQHFGEWIFR